MKNRRIDDVLKSYRGYLDEAVHDSVVRSRKKDFLAAHFRPEPFWGFQPVFLLPAIMLAAIFFLFQSLVPPRLAYIYPQPLKNVIASETQSTKEHGGFVRRFSGGQSQSGIASVAEPLRNDEFNQGLPIRVERINSQVGPTMVFQTNRDNIPVTIVWVFVGG
ncbi:MAG: hypothetical protein EXS63_03505 [Candidatus Omnitrophica bacterium]|nr:hypothetical protein [Candidatus Omnitrophota bacterium]